MLVRLMECCRWATMQMPTGIDCRRSKMDYAIYRYLQSKRSWKPRQLLRMAILDVREAMGFKRCFDA